MNRATIVALALLGTVSVSVLSAEAKSKVLQTIGTAGTANGQFHNACGIALDVAGNIWAVDSANNRVQEFSAGGQFIQAFGSYGSGYGELDTPGGIAVDQTGNVWVSDTRNNRIQEFSATGQFLQVVGDYGLGNGQFYRPSGIAVDAWGNIWVADLRNRVQEFTSGGQFLQSINSTAQNMYFNCPWGITFDSAGNVLVADSQGWRVQRFTTAGELLQSFGAGGGDGSDSGCSLAVDPSGNIWVSDRMHLFTDVYELSTDGVYEGSLLPGYFHNPQGLAADASWHLWVADGDRLVELSVPEPGTVSLLAFGGLALLRRRRK